MRYNFNYLNDKDFLEKLFKQKVKYHYAKIILLDFATENFYKEFFGKVTAGTVTLSATSAVKSTCSLTLVADEENNDLTTLDGEISLNKKFQVLIGYHNDIENYKHYGEIIWFPIGSVFVFTNVSINRSASGATISISAQDKMCLLNGTIAGELQSNTTFHEKNIINEDGSIEVQYPTIFQIIQESVNHLGKESLNNIVINDVPLEIKQPLQYEGSKNLYYGIDNNNNKILTLNKSECNKILNIFIPGDNVGYKYVDFIYPGELVLDAGSNVATVLDSIKKVIGNFQYSYDEQGIFHFNEIKNYYNTSYVPLTLIDNDYYTVNFSESTKSVYTFNDSEFIISYTNTPNYSNIKNDFVIWGQKTLNDIEKAICYHIAIDTKPECEIHYVVYYEDKNGNMMVRPPRENEIGSMVIPKDWRYELYLRGLENAVLGLANHDYYAELTAFFPEIYDFEKNDFKEAMIDNPENLTYWLDFIDKGSIVDKFSISAIGRRTKAITDTDLSIIYQRSVPDVIILNGDEEQDLNKKIVNYNLTSQDYVIVDSDLYNLFGNYSNKNTAFEKGRELLQEHTFFNEHISINSMPLFFLKPNDRISINNQKVGIAGDYIIQSINIPLASSGQMSLTASKATSRL